MENGADRGRLKHDMCAVQQELSQRSMLLGRNQFVGRSVVGRGNSLSAGGIEEAGVQAGVQRGYYNGTHR